MEKLVKTIIVLHVFILAISLNVSMTARISSVQDSDLTTISSVRDSNLTTISSVQDSDLTTISSVQDSHLTTISSVQDSNLTTISSVRDSDLTTISSVQDSNLTTISSLVKRGSQQLSLDQTPGKQCRNNTCGKYSYKRILATYKNLFQTSNDILNLENVYRHRPLIKYDNDTLETIDNKMLYSDNALCCGTRIVHMSKSHMVNIDGVNRTIIQLHDHTPSSYQFIPYASCLYTGQCQGQCVLQYQVIKLLVLNETGNCIFDSFSLPSYCSCMNVFG